MDNLTHHAEAFAELAHAGQTRRYHPHQPYHTHPRRVAGFVRAVGGTPVMIAAAHLHDVLEDTVATEADLYQNFPAEVVGLVVALTDHYTKERYPALSRKNRKVGEHLRLAAAGAEVHTIKLADMLDNTIGIATYDAKFAVTYLSELRHLLGLLDRGDARLRAAVRMALLAEEMSLTEGRRTAAA